MTKMDEHAHSYPCDTTLSSLTRGGSVIREFAQNCPPKPGCYCMLGENEELLYVGKAKNLKKRIANYVNPNQKSQRILRMIAQTQTMRITITDTEIEALLLESNFIKKQSPRYNILLKDDKSMPRLLIRRDHAFPRMVKHRGSQNENDDYFGPFPSTTAVNQALVSLQKIFQLRDCSDAVFARHQKQPCMRYQIKRCSAPCAGYIDSKNYQQSVDALKNFLSGNHDNVRHKIQQEMLTCSENMEYERAQRLRNQLKQLAQLTAFQKINLPGILDADIIAIACEANQFCIAIFFYRGGCLFGHRNYFPKHTADAPTEVIMASFLSQIYSRNIPPSVLLVNVMPEQTDFLCDALAKRRGGKLEIAMPQKGGRKKIVTHALSNAQQALHAKISSTLSWKKSLTLLQKQLQLPDLPRRIEIYDNSHIQGSHAVGAMVVADSEGLLKQAYRKFHIKTLKAQFGGDDYAMMDEVMHRRFARYKRQEKSWAIRPNILLIDGGKGQVSSVKAVLDALDIDGIALLGIAKGPDRHAGDEQFFTETGKTFKLAHNDPLLFFLQRLRDEAHRYALGVHLQKRHKKNFENPLDGITGIGSIRKKQLLQHFSSAQSIAAASLEDLQNVPGISKIMAKKLYHYFHE